MNRLKLCAVDGKKDEIESFYENHSTYHEGDAGLDLFCLEDQTVKKGMIGETIHFGIKCEMVNKSRTPSVCEGGLCYPSKKLSYMLVPRSSISNTPLRMSNSVGIIDMGYRGEIMAKVDNISDRNYTIHKGDRLFQLVHPSLKPFNLQFNPKEGLSQTSRGEGGFGSTNH